MGTSLKAGLLTSLLIALTAGLLTIFVLCPVVLITLMFIFCGGSILYLIGGLTYIVYKALYEHIEKREDSRPGTTEPPEFFRL